MNNQYSNDTKAAILAALLAGQAVSHVAAEYNIPRTTIQTWKAQLKSGELTKDSTQKKEIGELILEYMQCSIQTLTAQAEYFKDKEWLSKQSAESAAVLHGVMADKLFRMIEAIGKAYAASDQSSQD